jgi:hypothetical protein
MPGRHQYGSDSKSSGIILLWCSSSLSRPDSTCASYSFMGPWTLSASAVESISLSIMANPPGMSYIHSCADCAYPLFAPGMAHDATACGCARALTCCPCELLPALMLLLQSRHMVLLVSAVNTRFVVGIRLGVAWRERVRNPRIASDDVMFVVRATGGFTVP